MLYTRSSAVFGSASCQVPSASVYGCVLVTTSAERQTLGGPRTRGTDSWLDMTLTKIMVPTCLYCLNCTKFGQSILRKIIKIVATRCPILRLKCTKFDFGWDSAPDPAGGPYSAPPGPLAGFKGGLLLMEGREGEGKGGGGKWRGWRGGKGRRVRGRGGAPFNFLPPGATDLVMPQDKTRMIGLPHGETKLSYRKQIARQLRTQYVEGIYRSNYR